MLRYAFYNVASRWTSQLCVGVGAAARNGLALYKFQPLRNPQWRTLTTDVKPQIANQTEELERAFIAQVLGAGAKPTHVQVLEPGHLHSADVLPVMKQANAHELYALTLKIFFGRYPAAKMHLYDAYVLATEAAVELKDAPAVVSLYETALATCRDHSILCYSLMSIALKALTSVCDNLVLR